MDKALQYNAEGVEQLPLQRFTEKTYLDYPMCMPGRPGKGGRTVSPPSRRSVFSLSEKERAFIDGPVEELCCRLDDGQKTHYLSRLARGEEDPCFALTGPWAGSVAGAILDDGILCKGAIQRSEK